MALLEAVGEGERMMRMGFGWREGGRCVSRDCIVCDVEDTPYC